MNQKCFGCIRVGANFFQPNYYICVSHTHFIKINPRSLYRLSLWFFLAHSFSTKAGIKRYLPWDLNSRAKWAMAAIFQPVEYARTHSKVKCRVVSGKWKFVQLGYNIECSFERTVLFFCFFIVRVWLISLGVVEWEWAGFLFSFFLEGKNGNLLLV